MGADWGVASCETCGVSVRRRQDGRVDAMCACMDLGGMGVRG